MVFEVIGEITGVESIAIGNSIREIERLDRQYGLGRWRNLKGFATIKLLNGRVRRAELHWYEAHGLGRREIKWKRYRE